MHTQAKRCVGMIVMNLAIWWGIITTIQPVLAGESLYVAPAGDDGNDCLAPGDACATIKGALAKSGDVIKVATGIYTDAGKEVVLVARDVTLLGGWDKTFTIQSGLSIIDSEHARRGVHVIYGVQVTIDRFIIQNGAIFNVGERVGGSGVANFGQLTINRSSINNNTTWASGAIYNFGTLTLTQSAVNRNYAEGTSGIFSEGAVTLNNSTVSGNWSNDVGGAIHLARGTLSLNNSTVSENFALFSGGGISQSTDGYGYVRMQNSIVSGNESGVLPSCSGTIYSGGYNLIDDTDGCDFVASEGDQLMIDAQLEPLTGVPGYHPLHFGSPAIDAGNPAGCKDRFGNLLSTDQRDASRARRCDIGAYEYDGPYFPIFLPVIAQS